MTLKEQYNIGEVSLSFQEFANIVQVNESIRNLGKIKDIIGPFDGKINSIFRFIAEKGEYIFRARISKAFRYEAIIKEKILFPFLDGKLSKNSPNLADEVNEINNNKIGSYIFKNQPFIPVTIQNLLHYDETKEKLPYIFAIYEYIPGESLYYSLEDDRKNRPFVLGSEKYQRIFEQIGELSGKLHQIEFDGFYSDIREIGQKEKQKSWKDLFNEQLNKELKEIEKHQAIQPILPKIKEFFTKNIQLVESEDKAVLFHNDFQAQNLIVQEYQMDFGLQGVIDFDNWRIGPPAQDLVKIQYWTIKGHKTLNDAFFKGYMKIHKDIDIKELQTKINIYKMLWFILVYNFEMDKVLKNERNETVDKRFPAAEIYITEIKKVLELK